ncbi:tetratricopeptide repeat protein [Bacillus sp. XF8]|uniref:response regulator aspartate phosphatase n=1 Tax=Bacillus sp. XF8 TaxID=2819289 RepID=UPI001AA03113|nr:tetratricopeptide repeat protein [Bacillus sp. XF8]MBO1582784.1 tetratricopeptide repeat protein [Bacillus sp. XF8]
MNVSVLGNEKISNLLKNWYKEIRARHISSAKSLKEELKNSLNLIKENSDLSFYYHLLEFRYNYLINNLGIQKIDFDKIESFEIPEDSPLTYYYHFFKALHLEAIGNYIFAKEHYEQAERLLSYASDELEKAEFYYQLGYSYHKNQQALLSYKQIITAKEIFEKHSGCEMNIAFCNNILGLACINLREWELAEEHFTSAMDQFQKNGEEKFIIMVRHNLGWMYANQNLSDLALRYLSEVIEKSPKHYRAIYVKAKEHYKLNEKDVAAELIEKGIEICTELSNEAYQHHFAILKALNNNINAEQLEKIVHEGISYFEREELYEYIQEYQEALAIKFYQENLHSKASKYFYSGSKTRQKALDKGALK